MNRLTDNDRNFGPFTFAKWSKRFSASICSGDDEDSESQLLFVGFGHALRIRIPSFLIRPWREKKVSRRSGEPEHFWYQLHRREFGVSICDLGNGYDFVQVRYGAQTDDSLTEKSWCKHIPWKQWRCVRWSIYKPDGTIFASEQKGEYFAFWKKKVECPKTYFKFRDYDGEEIVATCMIEEREWHKGEGWFTWMRWFSRPKISRCLDLWFSSEIGPEKGSFKGGTIGHSIEMQSGETPQSAFERYCAKEHNRSGKKFTLEFIGPCDKPDEKISSDTTTTSTSSIQ